MYPYNSWGRKASLTQ